MYIKSLTIFNRFIAIDRVVNQQESQNNSQNSNISLYNGAGASTVPNTTATYSLEDFQNKVNILKERYGLSLNKTNQTQEISGPTNTTVFYNRASPSPSTIGNNQTSNTSERSRPLDVGLSTDMNNVKKEFADTDKSANYDTTKPGVMIDTNARSSHNVNTSIRENGGSKLLSDIRSQNQTNLGDYRTATGNSLGSAGLRNRSIDARSTPEPNATFNPLNIGSNPRNSFGKSQEYQGRNSGSGNIENIGQINTTGIDVKSENKDNILESVGAGIQAGSDNTIRSNYSAQGPIGGSVRSTESILQKLTEMKQKMANIVNRNAN